MPRRANFVGHDRSPASIPASTPTLPQLADARLRGQVEAAQFVDGVAEAGRAALGAAPHAARPTRRPSTASSSSASASASSATSSGGWSWVQNETDGYVGFVRTDAIGPLPPEPTHRVTALRTFVYPGPDMKLPPTASLSIGSRIALAGTIETRGTRFRLDRRAAARPIVACHVAPLDAPPEPDYVAVAERFLNVPYLWGGRTSIGLDCSALVQLALMAAGIAAPRDTDMQRDQLGAPGRGRHRRRRSAAATWCSGRATSPSSPRRTASSTPAATT